MLSKEDDASKTCNPPVMPHAAHVAILTRKMTARAHFASAPTKLPILCFVRVARSIRLRLREESTAT